MKQTTTPNKAIALWLFSICVVMFVMICLGGVTRLTGSGLSMVQWAPVTGFLPPLNPAEWLAVFELYQQTPEFQKVNVGMDLAGFKSIFWFEFLHRLLGRFIGILFFIPLVFFLLRYRLGSALSFKLIALFVLGGLQGVLGWYMVKSGLVNNPHVSQYRLVAHLGFALFIYCIILWTALSLFIDNFEERYRPAKSLITASKAMLILVFFTILAGGFVAGTHAGFAFNTFPLMNGHWIPEGYAALSPYWSNWFENIAAVQFNHRLLASVTLPGVVLLAFAILKSPFSPRLKMAAWWLLFFVVAQYALGLITLLWVVPVVPAALHQGVAVLLLSMSVLVARLLAGARASA